MDAKSLIYQFDDVSVDLEMFEVRKADIRARLEPKAFEALVFLIENRGRLVEKKELLDAVWKDSFVTENAMTRVIAQLRKALGDDSKEAKYIETVPTRGYRFIAEVEVSKELGHEAEEYPPSKEGTERIGSLAVLPLENLSGDLSQEYFADGMTDVLITELAKIGSLRVISRTSTMQYKKAGKPLPEIAWELNVDAVVEGTALRSGNRVRITAQLLHAPTDRHLWAESYERDLSDVLALQSEVARAIAKEIKIKLTPQEQLLLSNARAVNPKAWDDYLKGVYCFNQGRDKAPASEGVELLNKSFGYFHQAFKTEPDCALAYSGLGRAYHHLASYGLPELYAKSKAAALRAIELDDTLAEAHGALAYTLLKYEWDWEGAETEFKKAVELNRSYGEAHHGYALFLSASGRHDEAIAEIKLGEEMDPLSLVAKINLAQVYSCARQYDLALEQAQRANELNPDISFGRWMLGSVHTMRGEFTQAFVEFQKGLALSGGDPLNAAGLGYAYAVSGLGDEAKLVLAQLEGQPNDYYMAFPIALIYAALGEQGRAFEYLEKAYKVRSDLLIWLKVDPRLDSLRSDSRLTDLMRRVGFVA
jgi:TolB-like protein/Flp pilus assembly protein TadD